MDKNNFEIMNIKINVSEASSSSITKNEYRRFKIELEAICREKEKFPLFKNMKEVLKEKKDNYDFKVSGLFEVYNIENKNLFDVLDKIWEALYQKIFSLSNSLSLIMIACITGPLGPHSNNQGLESIMMKKYKELTCEYCCKFVEGLING
ncbi:MAG: hypothetical protein ACLR8H_12300 [Clostridium sp.]